MKICNRRRTIPWSLALSAVCLAIVGTAAAATSEGGHLPGFSAINKRVAVKKLPFEMRIAFGNSGGFVAGRHPIHGPVWFGEVKRPGGTIATAGVKRWVCQFETLNGSGSGSGTCGTLAQARELQMLSISSSCGKNGRQTRISGLVPDEATGLEIEREDGTIGRTVPVIENTVAFQIGRENVILRGVGSAAAERLERKLPLGEKPAFSGGACVGTVYVEGVATTEPGE